MALNIPYIVQNLQINIYISKVDIDVDDKVNIYQTDNPGDLTGVLIKERITGIEVENDPSSTGDAFLFTHREKISRPGIYSYYYTVIDPSGNESEPVTYFEHVCCLVPATPIAIDWNYLNFTGNTSGGGLNESLISHYKLNDTTTVIRDSSGNNHTGTFTNIPTSVPGKINEAIDFDGQLFDDKWFTVPNHTDIDTSDFAISFWLKTSEPVGTIFHYIYYSEAIPDGEGVVVRLFDGKINSFLNDNGTTAGIAISSIDTVNDNNWHFVVINYDRDGDATIWIDNVLDSTTDISSFSGSISNVSDFLYGITIRDYPAPITTLLFDGLLDSIATFDKVLTTDEMTDYWNSGDGTEDLSAGFQTVFHFPVGQADNPSQLVEDGDYIINTTTIGVDDPGEEVEYYRTVTDSSCDDLESADSPTSSQSITVNSLNLPFKDPTDTFINNLADGEFLLKWGYVVLINSRVPIDPIVGFNIYYMLLPDPGPADPSGECIDIVGTQYSLAIEYDGVPPFNGTVQSMVTYSVDGELYGISSGAGELLRYDGANNWDVVAPINDVGNKFLKDLIEFNGELYATTGSGNSLLKWNGTDAWIQLASATLEVGDSINSLIVYNEKLYGGTFSKQELHEYIPADDPENPSVGDYWVQIVPDNVSPASRGIISMIVYTNGSVESLYCGTDVGVLYRWDEVDEWEQVTTTSYGVDINDLVEFEGELYACTQFGDSALLKWNDVDDWILLYSDSWDGTETAFNTLVVYDDKLFTTTSPNGYLLQWDEVDDFIQVAGPVYNGGSTVRYDDTIVHECRIYSSLSGVTNTYKVYRWDTGDGGGGDDGVSGGMNPSAIGVWIFDGSTLHTPLIKQFSFNTRAFDHNTNVDFQIIPFSISGERENDDILSGIADDLSPIVETDTVITTLL